MSIMSAQIVRNTIIDEGTQPKDGFFVIVREEGFEAIVAAIEYDLSWSEEDAIRDALSGC